MSLFKLISCNSFVSLCKNSLIMDWRDQSLPQSNSSWTELGKQSLMCLFLFSLYLLIVFMLFTFIPRLDLGLLLLLLLMVTLILVTTFLYSTHHCISVSFESEFTTVLKQKSDKKFLNKFKHQYCITHSKFVINKTKLI